MMTFHLYACIPLLLMPVLFGGHLYAAKAESEATTHNEEYSYATEPVGREDGREQLKALLSFGDDRVLLSTEMSSPRAEEQIRLKMEADGSLVSGTRRRIERSGTVSEEKLWRDANKVYLEQSSADRRETSALDIPEGAILATEGSLVVLFRSFPYDSGTRWRLFLVDFSGRSAAGTASQAGVEHVTVPAGEFTCFRIEIVFHLPVVRPKVICWFAKEQPHILVKSIGKRGLLTPTYLTELLAQQPTSHKQ